MAVIDLREDPRTDLAIAQQIGGAVGGAVGQHFNRKLRKNVQEDFVQFMSNGVAAGKTVEELHADFPNIWRNAHARTVVEQDQERRSAELARRGKELRIQKDKQQMLVTATNQLRTLEKEEAEFLSGVEISVEDINPEIAKSFTTRKAEWQRIIQELSGSTGQGLSQAPPERSPGEIDPATSSIISDVQAQSDAVIQGGNLRAAPQTQPPAPGQPPLKDIARTAQGFIEPQSTAAPANPPQTTRDIHAQVDSGLLGEVDLLMGRTGAAAAPLSKNDQEIAAAIAEIPKIKDDAEFDALPSGTVFIDPEGNRRRKP